MNGNLHIRLSFYVAYINLNNHRPLSKNAQFETPPDKDARTYIWNTTCREMY